MFEEYYLRLQDSLCSGIECSNLTAVSADTAIFWGFQVAVITLNNSMCIAIYTSFAVWVMQKLKFNWPTNYQQPHWAGRLLSRGNGSDIIIAHVICADTQTCKLENRKAILVPTSRVHRLRPFDGS